MQLSGIRVETEVGYRLSFHETCEIDEPGADLYIPFIEGREEAWHLTWNGLWRSSSGYLVQRADGSWSCAHGDDRFC
jgi:hypothetical protein